MNSNNVREASNSSLIYRSFYERACDRQLKINKFREDAERNILRKFNEDSRCEIMKILKPRVVNSHTVDTTQPLSSETLQHLSAVTDEDSSNRLSLDQKEKSASIWTFFYRKLTFQPSSYHRLKPSKLEKCEAKINSLEEKIKSLYEMAEPSELAEMPLVKCSKFIKDTSKKIACIQLEISEYLKKKEQYVKGNPKIDIDKI